MFRHLVLLAMSLVFVLAAHAEIPNHPVNPCGGQCTKRMLNIYQDFLDNPYSPEFVPAVYSGDCYFRSRDYNPNYAHRGMIFLDHHPIEDNKFFFASGFHFFGSGNQYADYSIEYARERTEGAYRRYGPIEIKDGSTMRVFNPTPQGGIGFLYYMRQNPVTKDIYYITYWGGAYQVSFCILKKNPN